MMVQPKKGKGSAILRIQNSSDDIKPNYRKIKTSLDALPGVSNVSLNEVTNMVKVEYDPELLTLEDIRSAIESSKKL